MRPRRAWTWGRVFWLVCACALLWPRVAAAEAPRTHTWRAAQISTHGLSSHVARRHIDDTDADSESVIRRALVPQPALFRDSRLPASLDTTWSGAVRRATSCRTCAVASPFAPRPPPPAPLPH